MFYDKIKLMKNKKTILASTVSLAGISGAIFIGVLIKKRFEEMKKEQTKAELREFFEEFGKIDVLYINEFESNKAITRGGVIMTDGRAFQFIHRDGRVFYEE
jgi:hypothetical protein